MTQNKNKLEKEETAEIDFIGYCKECGEKVKQEDEIEEYEGIYQCPSCGHPNSKGDLWDTIPGYLIGKRSTK